MIVRTYIGVGDEDHVCDSATGKHQAGRDLRDKVDADLKIGHCHDDSSWKQEDEAGGQGNQDAPPGKVDRVAG